MILKNSFWDRLKQNAKRRNWCYLINTITLFLMLPVSMLVTMSGTASMDYTEKKRVEMLYGTAIDLIGFNSIVAFFILILAMFTAIQGYSYLHSRKKVDMYHSQPVSNCKRYWAIYLNGVLSFLVPYMICDVLSVIIAGTYGVVDGRMIQIGLMAILLNQCFFMAVYAVVIAVVMLTGNRMTVIAGSIALLFYGALLAMVYGIYRSIYFYTYYVNTTGFYGSFWGIQYTNDTLFRWSAAGFLMAVGDGYQYVVTEKMPVSELFLKYGGLFGGTILMAVLFTVVSYVLYGKRKAESAGTSMAFPATKNFFELVIGIPLALLIGNLIGATAGNSDAFFMLGAVLGMILVHIVFQLIYEADISKVFKRWGILVAGAAGALAVILVMYLDLFGFDSYVPKASELESAAYNINYSTYLDLDNTDKYSAEYYNGIDGEKYQEEHMYYTDIDNIMALAKESIFVKEKSLFGHHKICNMVDERNLDYEMGNERYLEITVCYRFKNGDEVRRLLYIDKEESAEALAKLVESREYKESYFQIYDERIVGENGGKEFNMELDDGFQTYKVEKDLAAGLREAYLADLDKFTYEMGMNERPLALINIYQDYDNDWPKYCCYIYPEYTETLNYLAENEIYKPISLDDLKPEKITFTTYDEETYDVERMVSYTDQEELKQILEVIDTRLPYSDYMQTDGGMTEIMLNDDDQYYLHLKDGAELPEFVQKDLQVTEETEE